MSYTAQGEVQKINTKGGTGKKGPWTLYSALINGDWFGCGFKAPAFSEGDTVEVTYEEGQYGKEIKGGKILSKGSGSSAPAPSSGGSKGGNASQGMAWGNASNVAATLISKMADVEALPLSAASSKAGKAKRFEEFMDLFNKIRVELYEDSLDIQRVLDKVADAGTVVEEEPAPLPEQAPPEPSEDDFDGGFSME